MECPRLRIVSSIEEHVVAFIDLVSSAVGFTALFDESNAAFFASTRTPEVKIAEIAVQRGLPPTHVAITIDANRSVVTYHLIVEVNVSYAGSCQMRWLGGQLFSRRIWGHTTPKITSRSRLGYWLPRWMMPITNALWNALSAPIRTRA
jgi:hypothetical protein